MNRYAITPTVRTRSITGAANFLICKNVEKTPHEDFFPVSRIDFLESKKNFYTLKTQDLRKTV
jgi:hypothetical protein